MIKAFPVIIDRQCPNLISSIGIGPPGGTSILRSGGLGPHIKFGGKIWGKVQANLPNKRKTWEVPSPQDAKVGKNPYFGVISEIQTAKFGVLITYTFGGKIWGFQQEFGKQILGPSRPTS